MSYLNFESKYDKFPKTKIKNHKAIRGYDAIYEELSSKIKENCTLVFDYYPGVDEEEVMQLIHRFDASCLIASYDLFKEEAVITEQMKYHLTDDRVFGKMYYGDFIDFIDEDDRRYSGVF